MPNDVDGCLKFLRAAEALKDTLRSAHTTNGRQESAAEHTWRLMLFVLVFGKEFPDVDLNRVLKICLIHDLGEAVHGDIPAPLQNANNPKSDQERLDFQQLTAPLPGTLRQEFLSLWDEYDQGRTGEARVARAMDKLETLLQHVQGKNPKDFDYAFNLSYGRSSTDSLPAASKIREPIDRQTAALADGSVQQPSSRGE